MPLHIITPLYRYELLAKVYQSIPKNDDIIWHIVKSSKRPELSDEFISLDPRIRLYEIDVEDANTVSKRNYVFEQIKDGYFIMLDDDTIFMHEAYDCYRHYSGIGFVGMVIGAQANKNMTIRLQAQFPEHNHSIDTGNAISHFSVLEKVKWEWAQPHSDWRQVLTRDFIFWNKCFQYFGKEKAIINPEVISVYNFLNPFNRI